MRLYLMFANLAYFQEKLEKSDLNESEKLDLKLSYLYQNDLKENAIYLADINPQKTPSWANFLSIYERKGEAENFKAKGYSPPPSYLANLYIQQGKINIAKDVANRALENSPDETQNHILWRSLFTKKSDENGLYCQIEDKDFAQSVSEGARFIIRDSKNLKIAVQGENERMNFFSGHGFSMREKNYSMFSIISAGRTWDIRISRKKRMEDFYSFYFQKIIDLKESYISFSAGVNEESKDTFSLENAGKVDFFSQEISKSFSKCLSVGFKNSFYNYKDQKGHYAGKSSLQEIYIFWPRTGLRPYVRTASYNRRSLPANSSLSLLYNYQNLSMLSKSFSEVGLNAYFFKNKGLSYSSRWEYPLSISISYNSRTFLNYSAQLNLKTPGIYGKDATLSITYAQGATAENT